MIFMMMIGVAGSGKSTLAQKVAQYYDAVVLSSDAIRAELWGSEEDQHNPSRVFKLMQQRTFNNLSHGRNVIYDATNLRSDRRAALLEAIRDQVDNVKCTAIVMDTPLSLCIENDAARNRTVGESVIKRQYYQLEYPRSNEQWDTIIDSNQMEVFLSTALPLD